MRQAAFGTGYEKESKDVLYEATKHITGTGNLLTSDSTSLPELQISELYKGSLNPSIPGFRDGIFAEIDSIGNISLDMCRLFGSTNSIVSKDQIPSVAKRLEKTYQEYLDSITSFIKKLKKTQKNLFSLVEEINAEDGFDEEEYLKIIEHNIDFYSSKPEISTKERPIIVSTKIFSDILDGIKAGHNIKEYKILLKKLIKDIKPSSSEQAKIDIKKIWNPLIKQHGLLDQKSDGNKLQKEVKKIFGNRVFRFIFNLPWTLIDRKNVLLATVSVLTLSLSTFWAISTYIAGEAGSPPIFGSSGFIWLDNFVTNLFRNTQWEEILIIFLITILAVWLFFFFVAKYVIANIERVGRKLYIQALPEILRDTKVFLWRTLINDWVLAEDRNELIQYLQSISNVLDNVHNLLVDKFLEVEISDDTIFQHRHIEPNPILEINLNSVSENGIYKDFEGSVSILKSDLISLLELSFDQEWMKIRGAIGRDMVPERIHENFKKNLDEFEKISPCSEPLGIMLSS